MALDLIKNDIHSPYMARSDETANQFTWGHPDKSFPRRAKVTFRSDEVSLIFRAGPFVGHSSPGIVLINAANEPFLEYRLIVRFTGDYHFFAELSIWGLLKKKWRVDRGGANEEGVGSTETLLSSDLPLDVSSRQMFLNAILRVLDQHH
jgi:hypothetical protein